MFLNLLPPDGRRNYTVLLEDSYHFTYLIFLASLSVSRSLSMSPTRVRVYVEASSETELADLLSKYVNKIESTLADNTFNTNTGQFGDGDNTNR